MPPAGALSRTPAILWAVGVTLATLVFGRVQNEGGLVGGDISLAKTLWLNLTILTFLVLPGLWWRDRGVEPAMRRIFGFVFASFLVRAAVELPIIYLTDWWRCSYGIAHDLATVGLIVALVFRTPATMRWRQRDASALLVMIVALLFVEAGFAYAFCSVADPGSGTYFASDAETFRAINRATWAAVVIGYSVLVVILVGRASAPRAKASTGTGNKSNLRTDSY